MLNMVRLLLLLLLFCLPVAAQQARVVESLPDGSFVIEIEGKGEFRALSPQKIAELAKQKLDLEAAQKKLDNADAQNAILAEKIQLLNEKLSLTEQQRNSVRNDLQDARVFIGQQKQLLEQETALRRESQQFIPHSQTKGFMGKVLTFLDSPYSQAFWKLAVPTYQMVRCSQ